MAVNLLSRTKQLVTQTATGVLTLAGEFNDFQSIEEGLEDAIGGGSAEGEQFEAIVMYQNQDYSTSWTRGVWELDSGTLIRQSTQRTKVQGLAATTSDLEFDGAQNLIVYGTMSTLAADVATLQSELDTAEADIDALETDVAAISEYMVPVWAEENGTLVASLYQFSFGNGGETPSDRGLAVYIPAGWNCEVVGMSLTINSGTATIELNVSGTLQGANGRVSVSSGNSNTVTLGSPIALSNADRLTFYTQAAGGTVSTLYNVATAWLRYYK